MLGADHPETLKTRNNLANAYQAAGRTAEAIEPQPSDPSVPKPFPEPSSVVVARLPFMSVQSRGRSFIRMAPAVASGPKPWIACL